VTAYWDDLAREVKDLSHLPDDDFVAAVIEIELRVIRAVSLTTGDREFPDDLRKRIQIILMTSAIDYTRYVSGRTGDENMRTISWLLNVRTSLLISDLHRIYHEVATRRPPNRYDTHFTDDPSSFLAAREATWEQAEWVQGNEAP